MVKSRVSLVALSLVMLLSACKANHATEAPTTAPTTQPLAVDTATPSPTVDTAAAISEGDLSDLIQVADLGPRREVEHGGFALDIPQGFFPMYRPGTLILRQEEGEMTLSVGGGLEIGPLDLETGLENFILAMSQDVADLSQSEHESILIDGQEGLATNFQGTLGGEPISGRLVYLVTSDLQFLVLMGFDAQVNWEQNGAEAYETFAATIELFPPTPMENLCPVSADPTFGFTQENPIRVGRGDPITGPSMERDYLDLLRGPNGEPVTYTRSGSLANDNTILDEYSVTYGDPQVTVTLYLDQYHDGQFRLPQGFSCGN